jgi:hypothetical protein
VVFWDKAAYNQGNWHQDFERIHLHHLQGNWIEHRDAQIPFYVFISILTLYTFRAHRAHHQERQIVSIQPLHTSRPRT